MGPTKGIRERKKEREESVHLNTIVPFHIWETVKREAYLNRIPMSQLVAQAVAYYVVHALGKEMAAVRPENVVQYELALDTMGRRHSRRIRKHE